MPTTTRAAVRWEPGQWWDIVELELDDPRAHEVLVRFEAAGLCHSDDHVRTGDVPVRYPMVGGHEGAGVVEKIGPMVERVKVGDRIVCSFIPVCGTCRPCSTGAQNLCESGRNAGTGALLDDSFRFHQGGQDLGGSCALGSFSERAVVNEWACVQLPADIQFEFGATQTFATAAEALEVVTADIWGRLADHALVTVGVLTSETVHHAVNVVGKNGTVTITAVGNVQELAVQANAAVLVGYQKRIQGTLFGGGSPLSEIPRMFELYRAGHLKLDELITTRYKLEQVSQGYQDMLEGRNLRGMI